jgi:putative transposase
VTCIRLLKAAQNAGAQRNAACKVLGLSVRTVQRWEKYPGRHDQRRGPHSSPPNALTPEEKVKILQIANSEKFRDLNPHKIVAKLADDGQYVSSESSLYRLLRENNLLTHRSKSRPRTKCPPRALVATGKNQVWSWDITYLPSVVKGQHFYLYMVEDIFSRLIVGWRVEMRESSDLAASMIDMCCTEQSIERNKIYLHSDNGSSMKGATMLATLQRLGIIPSFSRPSVSDDNPFSESLFKTVKYCPLYPSKPFSTLEESRIWVEKFVRWYNTEHLHSEIRFVTPFARHCGFDKEILEKRSIVYKNAKLANPLRWSKHTRNWDPIEKVHLNPEKDKKRKSDAIETQLA